MEHLEQSEIAKTKTPIIPGLTDDYTPEALAASWEKALHLLAAHPANKAILLDHGQEPYIFPISHKATINPDAIYIWTQQYFKWLQHPEFQPEVIKQLEEWASSHPEKPSQQRLERICNLYLRFIKKTHPADLTMAKKFALMLPSAIAYQPGYRNFKILDGFTPTLTIENIRAFQELADAQQDYDLKKYKGLKPETVAKAEDLTHLLCNALFVKQKTHLIDYLNKEQDRNGVRIAHPLCNAASILCCTILIMKQTPPPALIFESLGPYTQSLDGQAFLRDLGRLFDLNPRLPRPNGIPKGVEGKWENPYSIDTNIWGGLERACRNPDEAYSELSQIRALWQSPGLPKSVYQPKTWLGKCIYYLEGLAKLNQVIATGRAEILASLNSREKLPAGGVYL